MITETVEARARRLVDQEVVTCFSSIISIVAAAYGDAVCGDSVRDLAEEAFELACPVEDWEEAAIQAGWTHVKNDTHDYWWRDDKDGDGNDPDASEELGRTVFTADTAKGAVEEVDGGEAYQREVFEHWQVTEYFGEKLKEAGERVGNFADKTIWARTTTGQAIYADYVIETIAKALMA